MARIRSVHPGFFTDEAVVSCSFASRLLLVGLWTEADDGGVFQWKPVQLKMRLFPADAVDVVELLADLEAANIIRRYEIDGVEYGAIRNFTRFQRPKSPKYTHPRSPSIPAFCGMDDGSVAVVSETDPAEVSQFPKKSEIARPEVPSVPPSGEMSPQMEDGGDSMEDGGDNTEGDDGGAAAAATSPPRRRKSKEGYAWEGRVIRLIQRDFDQWQRSFPHLELAGQLAQLDAWLCKDAAQKQRDSWFQVVSGTLAKRNQAAADEARNRPAKPSSNDRWEETLARGKAEKQVEAEGLSPHTEAGMKRRAALMREMGYGG